MVSKTQIDKVIEKLQQDGNVSRNWCLRNYISRLSAIILALKKDGWDFETRYVKGIGKDFYYYATRTPYKKIVRVVPELGKKIVTYEKS